MWRINTSALIQYTLTVHRLNIWHGRLDMSKVNIKKQILTTNRFCFKRHDVLLILRKPAEDEYDWWLKETPNRLCVCLLTMDEDERQKDGEKGRGRQGVVYSYQSSQSSAAADKQKCEGQLRCRGLIDMADTQRITHTNTQAHAETNTYFLFCLLHLCKYRELHHLVTMSETFCISTVQWANYRPQMYELLELLSLKSIQK